MTVSANVSGDSCSCSGVGSVEKAPDDRGLRYVRGQSEIHSRLQVTSNKTHCKLSFLLLIFVFSPGLGNSPGIRT